MFICPLRPQLFAGELLALVGPLDPTAIAFDPAAPFTSSAAGAGARLPTPAKAAGGKGSQSQQQSQGGRAGRFVQPLLLVVAVVVVVLLLPLLLVLCLAKPAGASAACSEQPPVLPPWIAKRALATSLPVSLPFIMQGK